MTIGSVINSVIEGTVRGVTDANNNRYWVGGTDTWNATAGTKWAYYSGGPGGAPVPTIHDNVFFDANSGAGTCTASTNVYTLTCRNFDCTGYTGGFTMPSSSNLDVYGSFTLDAGMTFTGTSSAVNVVRMKAANGIHTVDVAGQQIGNINFDGAAEFDILSDIYVLFGIDFTRGTVNLNNREFWCQRFTSNNSNVRTINVGTSVFNCYAATQNVILNGTNLTADFTASTINITSTSSGPRISNSTLEVPLGTVTCVAAATSSVQFRLDPVSGQTLNIDTLIVNYPRRCAIFGGRSVAVNNITITGASGNVMTFNSTNTTQATISKPSGVVSVDYMNISYLNATGGATWYAGANSTDGGNNSGWIFTPPP